MSEERDSITWWSNRFNAVERDNRELRKEIERLNNIINDLLSKIAILEREVEKYEGF